MKSKLSRREFTKTTAAAFTILKAGSALTYAANEKLNIASVGAGGQAGGDIMSLSSENIVGLCDVDWNRANRCLLYTSPSPRDQRGSRMPSSA